MSEKVMSFRGFPLDLLWLGAEHTNLPVAADQAGEATPAAAIAVDCLDIARQLQSNLGKSGISHFSGVPDIFRADLARKIMGGPNWRRGFNTVLGELRP